MTNWQPIETAPKDGTPILLAYRMTSNEVHGYAPWKEVNAVIGWWEDDSYEQGWRICFMEDGAADSYGNSSQFFLVVPEDRIRWWTPLPEPPKQ